jgi:ethanolamine utilization microcompartment shell protein EutS
MTSPIERAATLRLDRHEAGPVLTATVPTELSADEFLKVAEVGYGLINRLTGCNCLSGRISFVVEENFAEVTRVQFGG